MFNFFKKDSRKSPKKLWQQFIGKKNTEDVLLEKAKALAPIIMALAVTESKDLKQYHELKRVSDDKLKKVASEMIPFYIHHADRVAFLYFEPEQRKEFIITLFTEVRRQLSGYCKNENDSIQFKSTFSDTFFNRQDEYSKYKTSGNKENGYKDDLFMQFSWKIARILGDEMDFRIVMRVYMAVVSSLSILQLPELFQE